MAYVAATLTSPNNRVAYYGQISAPSTVTQNVSLAFDPSDLGTYVVTGAHSGFCYTCVCWWFQNMQSWGSVNNTPIRLVPHNYRPCAPNGVGPPQPLNNQPVVNCNGTVVVSGWDGVNRNLDVSIG